MLGVNLGVPLVTLAHLMFSGFSRAPCRANIDPLTGPSLGSNIDTTLITDPGVTPINSESGIDLGMVS